ncbi:hypothetical protein [Salipiger mangrovisoli]|uniref:hypothetical protein n=1 Tax=Salipiger mangrovisoli TaxID=2865933 RepID=UPI001F11C5C3|nr:hypothetical protein [Salipiger mangrovisoli]
MIDKRMSDLNPYQELLSDPDPARSLAAMEIMLESGDENLKRMALEYGLLSPISTVKRIAFETFLKTKPIFSIRFDGANIESAQYVTRMRDWNGTLDADGIGYWRIPVGEYHEKNRCFGEASYRPNDCFVTVNSDGIFLTPYGMNARATISDTGSVTGVASLNNVTEPVAFTIRIID